MKKMLLLVLASALTAAPAYAVEVGSEVFINYKATQTDGSKGQEGTDIARFRLFVSQKFTDQWSFKGSLDTKTDTTGTKAIWIKDAHIQGTDLLMAGDTLKFGAQQIAGFKHDNFAGMYWAAIDVATAEQFFIESFQNGVSYAMNFSGLGVTLFSLSGKAPDITDVDENKLNGVLLDYKFGDTTVWVQNTNSNTATSANVGAKLAATAKGMAVLSGGAYYKVDAMDIGFAYHSATYTVDTGTAPKANTVLGLNGLFKKIAGSNTNFYVSYFTGYDKFEDTGEDTLAKMTVGPTWKLADGKIDFGVFYESETYQSAWKDASAANTATKEPSALWVKMAAKF